MISLFTSVLASEYGVTLSRTGKISHKARVILECGRQLQSKLPYTPNECSPTILMAVIALKPMSNF